MGAINTMSLQPASSTSGQGGWLFDMWQKLASKNPVLMTEQSGKGDASSKVQIKCDVEGFVSALSASFLRRVPVPPALQIVHKDIKVGTEQEAALLQHKAIKAEIKTIEAARDGIRRALSISESEFQEMQRELDAQS